MSEINLPGFHSELCEKNPLLQNILHIWVYQRYKCIYIFTHNEYTLINDSKVLFLSFNLMALIDHIHEVIEENLFLTPNFHVLNSSQCLSIIDSNFYDRKGHYFTFWTSESIA